MSDLGLGSSTRAVSISAHLCAWLNLIEPWWKTLRSLALNGRRFEGAKELVEAIDLGTKYWNEHCHPYQWRKSYSYNHL